MRKQHAVASYLFTVVLLLTFYCSKRVDGPQAFDISDDHIYRCSVMKAVNHGQKPNIWNNKYISEHQDKTKDKNPFINIWWMDFLVLPRLSAG